MKDSDAPQSESGPSTQPETWAAQGLHFIDEATGAVVPAVHPSTTFARNANYGLPTHGASYIREDNPSYALAERLLARLEGGEDALLFASGMAAATAVLQSLLRPGDHVVVPEVLYWGLRNSLKTFCADWGISLTECAMTQPGALGKAMRPGRTRLVWVETPANPTWDVVDIAAAAAVTHDAGAILLVDSTVATPVLTQPLRLGADLVLHSATKYLNGHSDVLAGALVTAQRDASWSKISAQRAEGGAMLGPFEAWLLQRGMRTLFLRVRQASASALFLAQKLRAHPLGLKVRYPGLVDHPAYAVAQRQMVGGFGGMLSVAVPGGAKAALEVVRRCRIFVPATSLGGVESLIEHRASIEGAGSPVPDNLLRLSVGIEAQEDLWNDLEQAIQDLR